MHSGLSALGDASDFSKFLSPAPGWYVVRWASGVRANRVDFARGPGVTLTRRSHLPDRYWMRGHPVEARSRRE